MTGTPAQKRAVAIDLLVLGGFCAFLFFFGLGSFGLAGADEPRYAQIAREMLARHDWVTPVLNGVPWLEKPALYYWSAMLSYKIFGVRDWAARVPSALMASAMVFAIYGFMRREQRGPAASTLALDAALMTSSCAAVVGFARAASTDMPLAATFTIGMLAWWQWYELMIADCRLTIDQRLNSQSTIVNQQSSITSRRWLLVFYVFMALGTLAKGPVAAFLAGLIIVGFAVLRHGSETRATQFRRIVLGTLWWPGVLLYLAVALPWYVAVQLATGNFFRVFILEHNLERFGTNLYRHHQPFWYYAPVLLLSVLPWTVMFIAGLMAGLRGVVDGPRLPIDGKTAKHREPATNHWRLFLLLWVALPVIFFSFSASKLAGYILPAIPACTLLAAEWLRERREARWWLALLHSAMAALVLAAVLLAPHALVKTRPPAAVVMTAAIAAAIIFIAMVVSLRTRGLAVARFVTLVPVVLAVAFIVRVAAPVLDASQSARPVAQKIDNLGYPARSPVLTFAVKRETVFGLPFYRDAGVIEYAGGALPFTPAMIVTRDAAALLAKVPTGTVLAHVGQVRAQGIELYMSLPAAGHR